MCNKYEPNRAISIAKGKCPQCQSGKVFLYPVYELNKFTQMSRNCPVCNLTFEIEPGFFWGAMYVSYGITTAMMLIVGGLVYFFSNHHAEFWGYMIPIFLSMFLSIPFTYRYARVLMLSFFSPIKFIKELANKN